MILNFIGIILGKAGFPCLIYYKKGNYVCVCVFCMEIQKHCTNLNKIWQGVPHLGKKALRLVSTQSFTLGSRFSPLYFCKKLKKQQFHSTPNLLGWSFFRICNMNLEGPGHLPKSTLVLFDDSYNNPWGLGKPNWGLR